MAVRRSKAARTGEGRKKLTVRVKPHTRADGTRVRGHTRKIKDRGAPGRGKATITLSDRPGFGEGFTRMSRAAQDRIVRNLVEQRGPTTVIREAGAKRALLSRTSPRASDIFRRVQDDIRRKYGTDRALKPAGKRLLGPRKAARLARPKKRGK